MRDTVSRYLQNAGICSNKQRYAAIHGIDPEKLREAKCKQFHRSVTFIILPRHHKSYPAIANFYDFKHELGTPVRALSSFLYWYPKIVDIYMHV